MENNHSINIINITDTSMPVTFTEEGGNILLKNVPISRVLLALMACAYDSDESLAHLASINSQVKIGTNGRPVDNLKDKS